VIIRIPAALLVKETLWKVWEPLTNEPEELVIDITEVLALKVKLVEVKKDKSVIVTVLEPRVIVLVFELFDKNGPPVTL
jgi:hypothetical protein